MGLLRYFRDRLIGPFCVPWDVLCRLQAANSQFSNKSLTHFRFSGQKKQILLSRAALVGPKRIIAEIGCLHRGQLSCKTVTDRISQSFANGSATCTCNACPIQAFVLRRSFFLPSFAGICLGLWIRKQFSQPRWVRPRASAVIHYWYCKTSSSIYDKASKEYDFK